MKKLIFVICLSPMLAFAQNKNPYHYFKIENKTVVFENTYNYDGYNKEKLKEALLSILEYKDIQ